MIRPGKTSAQTAPTARAGYWQGIVRGHPHFKTTELYVSITTAVTSDKRIIELIDLQFGHLGAKGKAGGAERLIVWLSFTARMSARWRNELEAPFFPLFVERLRHPNREVRSAIAPLVDYAKTLSSSSRAHINALAEDFVRGEQGRMLLDRTWANFWSADDIKSRVKPESAWNGMVVRRLARDYGLFRSMKNGYATIAHLAQLAGCSAATVDTKYVRKILTR